MKFQIFNFILRDKAVIYYLIIGGLSTAFNYFIFSILYGFLNFDSILSSAIAYLSGIFVSYPLNKNITFQKKSRKKNQNYKEFLKYTLVYSVTLGLGLCFFNLAVNLTPLSPYIIQGLQIVLITVINFLLLKWFVFLK